MRFETTLFSPDIFWVISHAVWDVLVRHVEKQIITDHSYFSPYKPMAKNQVLSMAYMVICVENVTVMGYDV